jgi:hypothetical protein
MDPTPNRAPAIGTSLDRHIEALLSDVHTSIPAFIVKYTAGTPPLADVKPSLIQVFVDDDGNEIPCEHPVITHCPVAFPQGGGGYLSFPLKVGDPVLLLCAQRSLDAWLETDGKTPIAPGDYRRHHITDGVILPGIGTARVGIPAHATDVVLGLTDGSAEFHLQPGGHVYLKCLDIKLGSAGASDPMAKANETQSRLSAIEGKLTSVTAALAAAGGGFVPPGILPFIADLSDIHSTKVFTDA